MTSDREAAPGERDCQATGSMGAHSAPLAWVHGYTMSSAIWAEAWGLMPERAHIGIDLPGHGRHAGEAMPRELSAWADHVAEGMRAAGARELVGLSFGSAVALQVAADHPDLVDRLVLAAPTLCGVPDDREARAKYFLLMLRMREHGPGRALARVWMTDPPPIFRGLRAHPQRYAAMEDVVAEHPFAELRNGAMSRISATVQGPDLLARVRCPILLVVGTDDMPQFRENTEVIARHTAGARVATLDGLGHLPLLEAPEACLPAVRDFLAKPAAARPILAAASR